MHFKKYMKINKNSIISLLLGYILNMYDGWVVTGLARCIVNIALIILLTLLFNEIDKKIRR